MGRANGLGLQHSGEQLTCLQTQAWDAARDFSVHAGKYQILSASDVACIVYMVNLGVLVLAKS